MLKKLVNVFINATKDKCTKRGVEWIMADFIYVIYLLIMLIDFAVFASCGVWWTMLATAVMFMFMIYGWGTFSYYLRKTLLEMLYPPATKTDENGDSEMTYLDEIAQIMKNLKDELEDMKEK